jgi:multiple sugar transport system permease protein
MSSTLTRARGLWGTRSRRLNRRALQQNIFVLLVLIPLIISFWLFWLYPALYGLVGSFTQWRGFDPNTPFIGLGNYQRAFNDPVFRISLRNTFYFALLSVPPTIALALLLALAIESTRRFRSFFRMVYFLPVVTPVIATALIWKFLYQPSYGLFNQILMLADLPTQRWLISSQQALPSVALFTIWKNVGFSMVIFMAGLTTIPQTYYDAAKVDGANRWHQFWHVTLPLLRPTFIFVLVTSIIGSFQVFGPIFIMTSGGDSLPGGPNNATMVLSVYQWLSAFRQLELGYGAAMGIILFVIILVITLVQFKVLQTRWEY